ncbi:MAG: hypothetical protein ACOYMQ_07735 [Pseudanabaena sp.]|jgi:hypothetical protein
MAQNNQNKWFRSFVKYLPSILTVAAVIVDDANKNDTDLYHQPDTSDLTFDESVDLEIVTIEETEIVQVDQISVQGLFTSEEWSYIVKKLE